MVRPTTMLGLVRTNECFYRKSVGIDPSGGISRDHADRGMRRALGHKCYTHASGYAHFPADGWSVYAQHARGLVREEE